MHTALAKRSLAKGRAHCGERGKSRGKRNMEDGQIRCGCKLGCPGSDHFVVIAWWHDRLAQTKARGCMGPFCCLPQDPRSPNSFSTGLKLANSSFWHGPSALWTWPTPQQKKLYLRRKNLFYLLNYLQSLVFLPALENWINHLPQLLKPFILPQWPSYRWFSNAVLSFSFLIILAEYLKNHNKS